MRWIRRLLVALLVLVVVAAVAGTWLVRRSFPDTGGEVTVGTLEAPVTVSRDEAGLPHIRATTSHDLFLAQGYIHAQDRFWQMDTWRHIGAGRLSEMFGESQVETDAFLRTLGFERLAEEAYASAPDHVREALDAYADGVNAYLAERPGGAALSLEYAVLGLQNSGYAPSRWDPVDSLTWAHVMAWDLRANLEQEIDRAVVAGIVGIDRTEQLYPPYPETHPVIVPDSSRTGATVDRTVLSEEAVGGALGRVAGNIARVEAVMGSPFEGIGSNNWVVDGSHTESGAPLLANDPHLSIQMPSIWYQTVLWCEEVRDDCPYRVSGFSFPGAPGVVIGHNERIAWGVTNLAPDTMDLFIERTDGDRYEVDGEMVDFEVRSETISVAGGEDVELEIRSTRHGPVVSGRLGDLDDLDSDGIDLPDEYEVSLAWKALEPSTLFQSLLGINAAAEWDDFRSAAALFDVAAQNLIYADVDGHIGYQATGDIPIRRSGDGRYPAPGWTSEHEWEGSIPFEDLPSMLDPPSGVIVTANQPVVGDGYDGLIGIDHAYGYRALRINELLLDSAPLTVEDMAAIQMDGREGSAETVVPRVLALSSTDPAIEAIQEVLDRWGPTASEPFQMSPSSPGAAAYAATWRHLLAVTFDELPEDRGASGGSRYFEVVRRLLDEPSDPWWDVTDTPESETADDVLRQAVIAAHEELTATLGDDPLEWRWDDLHAAHFENQTLGQSGVSPIEMLFNRAVTSNVGGGSSVVNATSWSAPDGYEVIAVPSLRMVVDLGDFSRSVGIHTTGQSGHAFHSHYFDMAEDWALGRLRPLPFDPEVFVATSSLSLSRGSSSGG